jgi:predicted glycogen debranching enzyme
MIECDKPTCRDFSRASALEWLETNGLGGFACSTICGLNTRRYHGLLTVATRPPVGRYLLLSKLEERLVVGDQRFDFGTNHYPGTIHPRGFELLSAFRLDPFPIFTFDIAGVQLEKLVFMLHEMNAVVVYYRVLSAPQHVPLQLEIHPLIAFRDYHGLSHENSNLNPAVTQEPGIARIRPYGDLPELRFAHNAIAVDPQAFWYRKFQYTVEAERGLDSSEDLFNPLTFRFQFSPGQNATVIASLEPLQVQDAPKLERDEIGRRQKITTSAAGTEPFAAQLALAADQFLVRRANGFTVIAGYPWFTDWGRDTMIALPGLTLFNTRADIAKGILQQFSQSVDMGMLPNRFPDAGESPQFNSADSTLWFFEAVRAYLERTGDREFVEKHLYAALIDILEWHIRGTRYSIRALDNGLLRAGQAGVQLTWMDAKIGDRVVTPRAGLPVEIQALWFNALSITSDLARAFGDNDTEKRASNLASSARDSFNRLFWNQAANCLFDVIDDDGSPDPSVRPNQIFAVSLRHSMLANDRQAAVLDVVERELLTPYGLRSLSPRDPDYKGRYQGGPAERDAAYHQGTTWPYLIGPFVTAYRKVHGSAPATLARIRETLRPLVDSLHDGALGQCAEIYDGDPPQRPCGCFAQAWTVGELIRALNEDAFPEWHSSAKK